LNDRLANLDGARGVAAMVVLFFHGLVYSGQMLGSKVGIGDLLSLSPLAWLVSGGGAVVVFFVLSGFVLERATQGSFHPTTSRWLAARLLRLYLPIYPMLLIAFAMKQATQSSQDSHDSDLVFSLLLDSTLIAGHGNILGVLWSLRWEIIFSISLPFMSVLLRKVRNIGPIWIAACVLCSGFGNVVNVGAIQYLPMIAAGFFLSGFMRVCPLPEKPVPGSTAITNLNNWGKLIVPLILIGLDHQFNVLSRLVGLEGFEVVQVGAQMLTLLGSVMLVQALHNMPTPKGTARNILDFLGKISFSLYLVRGPILEFAVVVFAGRPLLQVISGCVASVLIAKFYFDTIESPTLAFSRRLRKVKE
jgi:peptidoglycan/LPS O-acetylase OafA/YrhL